MAKNKGIHISKNKVEEIMKVFCGSGILDIKVLNNVSKQTRYKLIKNGCTFSLDIYYRQDKTCTIREQGQDESLMLSKELKDVIVESVEYTDPMKIVFSVNISREIYDKLVEYLVSENDITKSLEEDKGYNGFITKYSTEFGDKATLTFYNNTGKLLYQGYMMSIYVSIKVFLMTLDDTIIDTDFMENNKLAINTNAVQKFIDNYISGYYSNTDDIIKSFIEDSVTMYISNDKLNDYGVWTVPILRVLEHRIKEILSFDGIILNDKKGFRIGNSHIFIESSTPGVHVVNSTIGINSAYIPCLADCYNYFKDNRHGLFHGSQFSATFVTKSKPHDAQAIIIKVCELIEKSYKIIGK